MTLSAKMFPPLFVFVLCAPALAQDTVGKGDGGQDGQILYNNACRTCHTLREGDNRLGPNLHKIMGRKAGSLSGYGYSSAMKGADLTWDKATLDRFIANPDQVVSGHSMRPYGGIASADERAKIIAFLEAQ
jgi:cytochrome c